MDPEPETRPAGLIGAVDNVLKLLRLFEGRELLRVNQVSREMGLSRSTVHRMLATLNYHQFVEQDEHSRGYRAGPALVDIGLAVVQNMDVRAVAYGALVRLRDETGETVHLATRRGNEVLYVEGVEGERILKTGSRVGWRLPAHATAAGKAILAELTDQELAALYPAETLSTATERAVGSLTALREALAEVRLCGYATNDAESEEDVSGVGAVVKDRQGKVCAAVVVTGPRSRADQGWIERVAGATMRTAKELSGIIL
ncbi:IclR family transcriptional regulator [Amycolatopsis sp. ATCC 39116]|uniref:IclR family transcriptional regulator n=1 Tax=Amycolatopsis sp. (strain ATCC 39116 / 75iv2) TaxID=385957 RepID=UPI00030147BD|nr:IclR family transcriptional regulator [Amycolatopsis sp. ATCC 39116]